MSSNSVKNPPRPIELTDLEQVTGGNHKLRAYRKLKKGFRRPVRRAARRLDRAIERDARKRGH